MGMDYIVMNIESIEIKYQFKSIQINIYDYCKYPFTNKIDNINLTL